MVIHLSSFDGFIYELCADVRVIQQGSLLTPAEDELQAINWSSLNASLSQLFRVLNRTDLMRLN